MRKTILILLAFTLCIWLAACAADESSGLSQTRSGEDAAYVTPVTVRYFPEGEIAKESCIQYTDHKMDLPSETVLISTTQTVSDFKFLVVQFNFETEKYEVVEELYSLEELTPAQPLMINTVVSETLADRGFCFTDGEGNIRYFYFTYDTRDEGTITCSPMTN